MRCVHLIALARRAGMPLTLDRSRCACAHDAAGREHPAGRQVFDGGFLLRRRACGRCWRRSATSSTLDARTVNGRTLGENVSGAEVFNDDVILPRDKALGGESAASRCCAAILRRTAP